MFIWFTWHSSQIHEPIQKHILLCLSFSWFLHFGPTFSTIKINDHFKCLTSFLKHIIFTYFSRDPESNETIQIENLKKEETTKKTEPKRKRKSKKGVITVECSGLLCDGSTRHTYKIDRGNDSYYTSAGFRLILAFSYPEKRLTLDNSKCEIFSHFKIFWHVFI